MCYATDIKGKVWHVKGVFAVKEFLISSLSLCKKKILTIFLLHLQSEQVY